MGDGHQLGGLLLLPLWLGIDGVMLAGPIADFIAFVVSVVLVRKELKRQAALSK